MTSRSITLINKAINATSYHQIKVEHLNITALTIYTNLFPIDIYNIYNDGTTPNTVQFIRWYMQNIYLLHLAAEQQIWVGNFNWHHPLWDEPRNLHLFTPRNLDAAESLI